MRTMILLFLLAEAAFAGSFRLVRAMAGPTGKVAGSKFVFDESRNRFVFPQDKSFIVYFEFEAPPGTHTLTGYWKAPDGRITSISPDIKLETKTTELNAYWTYEIDRNLASGIWTLEVRIDGEPSGTHSFEIVVPPAATPAEPAPAAPVHTAPTMAEIYAKAEKSLVTVHKIDPAGRRIDSSLGFVVSADHVITAFQAIDAAATLDIEFADGRHESTDQLWKWHRLGDWAVVRVPTKTTPALQRGDPKAAEVGQRLLMFGTDATQGSRIIGGVDISGRKSIPPFGERIQLQPAPAPASAGGPLLSLEGQVVGVIGGSVTPGARFDRRNMSVSPSLWTNMNSGAAIPITAVLLDVTATTFTTLKTLTDSGVLTAPMFATPSLLYGGTANTVPKDAASGSPRDVSEFSRQDQQVWVYSYWQKKDKVGRGVLSAKVYDALNTVKVVIEPKKITIPDNAPTRVTFSFSPASLPPGTYRVDILWNDQPAWRTFFSITN